MFRTPFLAIPPELLGRAHAFQVDGKTASVKLPVAPQVGREDPEILALRSWREVAGEKLPIDYDVGRVEVVVHASARIELPDEMLQRSPNAYDLVGPADQERLNELADTQYEHARRAMDLVAYDALEDQPVAARSRR